MLGKWRGPVASAAPEFHVSRHKGNRTPELRRQLVFGLHTCFLTCIRKLAPMCNAFSHMHTHKRKENTFQFQQRSLSVCCRIIKMKVENPQEPVHLFFYSLTCRVSKVSQSVAPCLFLMVPWLIQAMKSMDPMQ